MAELERVGIVGLGLIGGSLALALRRARPGIEIVGVDEDPRTCELALGENAVAAATALQIADLSTCDVVVLCTPAQALIELLPVVARRMRRGALLTDVCGAKERICGAGGMQDLVVFVGAHPMAGTEFRGFVAASPALFFGCTVAICPPVGIPDPTAQHEAIRTVRDLWMAAGAGTLLDVDPATHDRAVTLASHLPYLAAAAVAQSLLEAGEDAALARELAAGGFRDTTRLAGDGTVAGAAALNRFVPEAARALAQRLRALADALEQDPAGALRTLGDTAERRRRMRLPPLSPAMKNPR
ncbi:MAG TPA: prephenate dehydrogenase/arogenate dehydrogenase family protein [Myxococcales bacterium]|nr:prephenate dehydrogenase/arogenate dehydrogenase family protein [Myxococcales bacterium]